MFARIFFLVFAGMWYFPLILHVPIIPLDPDLIIEDTTTRIVVSIIFWLTFIFFDGKCFHNAPSGGY